jgi:tetratricopeptide (TPR) repeat protein
MSGIPPARALIGWSATSKAFTKSSAGAAGRRKKMRYWNLGLALAGLACLAVVPAALVLAAEEEKPQAMSQVGGEKDPATNELIAEAQAKSEACPQGEVSAETRSTAVKLLDQGELAFVSQNYRKARDKWRQALEAWPGYPVAEGRLANLDKRKQHYEAKLARIQRQRQAKLALVEGVSQFNARRFQEAANSFRSYLEVFPDSHKGQQYLKLAEKWAAKGS